MLDLRDFIGKDMHAGQTLDFYFKSQKIGTGLVLISESNELKFEGKLDRPIWFGIQGNFAANLKLLSEQMAYLKASIDHPNRTVENKLVHYGQAQYWFWVYTVEPIWVCLWRGKETTHTVISISVYWMNYLYAVPTGEILSTESLKQLDQIIPLQINEQHKEKLSRLR